MSNDRYVVKDEGDGFGIVIDTHTGRELCPAQSCETPEDASVFRAFAPLLQELNRLAQEHASLDRHIASISQSMLRGGRR